MEAYSNPIKVVNSGYQQNLLNLTI